MDWMTAADIAIREAISTLMDVHNVRYETITNAIADKNNKIESQMIKLFGSMEPEAVEMILRELPVEMFQAVANA
jgi:hypothetical protein